MMQKKKRLREFFGTIAIACLLVFLAKIFVFFPTTVKGASMKPTLQDGDKLIVNKLAKQFESYGREDIIVVKTDNFYVKRVIGLPGDVIEVRNDQLYVNHEVTQEAYLYSNKKQAEKKLMNLTEDFGPITVPKNKIFVMGDNRLISRDSRNGLGLIDREDVLGELAAIYYPIEHMKIMN
ncbi:S26 family signal peptidase [Bacillus wiedmannii]|jgi:signal peptidase I|uniref:Signal peptidase I n=3 Tax=Bacillus cereus group TaxID=86661 RepID=A0A2A7XLT9_9BACI|nr:MULTISPECIES: signal peptidase I [Bacillus]OUB39761.1 signal peptidase I [Bacillus thuringiensis serovar argentinensis]EJQ44245.1 signal peptidase I [Bacillus wiedmannii]KAA0767930.1 signal peptidase I [Bacillus sp. BB51/4]KMP24071.1 signal peptidase [Bacillus wiedmannii]KXY07556.1 S26 family signal peptidase [Bacillus wiedmannii]